ncbi:MAG: rhomboid family intramembrane serine protease [Firmicutes bacterium]|nr:rhomboid family intramembrane serine protease [Bacillota bacterium]
MPSLMIRKSDQIMMRLVHYFVTKENYIPINVQGAKDEVWLENLEGPYRVIRINTNTIINNEQFKYDLFKVRYIIKQIKRKTLSLKINTLNICLDVSNKVDLKNNFNINSIKVDSLKEIKGNEHLLNVFPKIKDEFLDGKDNIEMILNVTNDINNTTEKNNKVFSKLFSPKKIIVTKIIMFICFLSFISMYVFGEGSNNVYTLVNFGANSLSLIKDWQLWRLITCAFLHIGFMHLFLNMYSLAIIGPQVEGFVGKVKFLLIYLISALCGSLLSVVMVANDYVVSAGASGAIFGLLGSLLYFGYHFRLYLSEALRSQIIPVIVLNLVIGFMIDGIDVAAHIGGLIGGYLATMAFGIEGKSHKKDQINGSIVLISLISFLFYIALFVK